MNKKLILALSLLMAGLVGTVQAGSNRGVPIDQTGQSIQTPAFVGVSYATTAFPVSGTDVLTTTVTYSTQTVAGKYSVFGVVFSSGNCGSFDRVDLFDSTNTRLSQGSPTMSLYNVNGSTNVSSGNASACAGFSGPPVPVRFTQGLLFKPSSAGYNIITILYHKEGD